MNCEESYVKFYRKLLNWRWFQDANTYLIWSYILLSANWEDHDFEKVTVKRGQLVTSYQTMSKDTGLSIKCVRKAIEHLKDTGEVTVKLYPRYQVITIPNYDSYQGKGQAKGRLRAGKRQAEGNNIIMEEEKEFKNTNTKVFVIPTVDEVRSYCDERHNSVDPEHFVDFYQAKGWMVGKNKMKDWKAAIRNWEKSTNRTRDPKRTPLSVQEMEDFVNKLNGENKKW